MKIGAMMAHFAEALPMNRLMNMDKTMKLSMRKMGPNPSAWRLSGALHRENVAEIGPVEISDELCGEKDEHGVGAERRDGRAHAFHDLSVVFDRSRASAVGGR